MLRLSRIVFAVSLIGLALPVPGCTCGSGNGASAGADAGSDVVVDTSALDTSTADTGGPKDAPGEGESGLGSFPPTAGNSGAFGVVTVGTKQKMYLPVFTLGDAGHAVIAVVDVGIAGMGVSGAPALITTIDLGTTNHATTTGGDPTAIVAASTDSTDVWFIDPTTDTLVKHINLDSTYGMSSFSGAGGYVTGIAADPEMHVAILSVWNGFALADLTTQSITTVIQAPPSENFGYDSLRHIVYAPFYNCASSVSNGMHPSACNTPMTPADAGPVSNRGQVMLNGVSVITLSDNTVYTYENTAAMDPDNPVGPGPDSAGVDPIHQMVVVPSETDGFQNLIDFSMASFDMASKTVSAPLRVLTGVTFEGVAVEPTSRLAFFAKEAGTDIVVVSLPSAYMGNQASVAGTMPVLPAGDGPFHHLGDPHGLAVTTLMSSGRAVGLVVDGNRRWVGRVDLQMLAALEMSDASVTADVAQMDTAVTYLDATTIE